MKTKMTTHTPGPWCDDSTLPPSTRPVIARTARGLPISANWEGPIPQGQDDANAYLIAAAPDLLEAAKEIADTCIRVKDPRMGGTTDLEAVGFASIDRLRAAIAKAESRKVKS